MGGGTTKFNMPRGPYGGYNVVGLVSGVRIKKVKKK